MKYKRIVKRNSLRFILLFVFTLSSVSSVHAQLLEKRVSINFNGASMDKCILQLQQAVGVPFAYETSGLEGLQGKSGSFKQEKLRHVLEYLLKGTHYHFQERHNIIVIGPDAYLKSKEKQLHEFRGILEDKRTGERLAGAAVYNSANGNVGTYTDKDGYFNLTAATDTLRLTVSYHIYKPVEITLRAVDAPIVHIKMDVVPSALDSVLVISSMEIIPFSSLTRVRPSVSKLAFLPRFCGNADLLSMIKMNPGIQESNDGSGSLIVRGGAPDQNLTLMDNMNIYGATHLFGLLSAVNTSGVKEVNVYKGAFPSRYSGRISSVWDVTLKEGDPQQYHGNFTAGTLASDFMLSGPIFKNKTTFALSGRKSYHDLYVRLFTPGIVLNFQDLTLKLHHNFSRKDDLYFSGYTSDDRFQLGMDTAVNEIKEGTGLRFDTKNKAATLQWRHFYSSRLLSELSLIYSGYSLLTKNYHSWTDGFLSIKDEQRLNTGLDDITGRFCMKYYLNDDHALESGFYYTKHMFAPHTNTISQSVSGPITLDTSILEIIRDKAVHEEGFFLEDNWTLSALAKIAVGVHFNNYTYQSKSYFTFQPRLSLRLALNKQWHLNAAYVRVSQNLHRLSISQTSLPVDFWTPSTDLIKPQLSDQFSVGVTRKFLDGVIEASAESYYKRLVNVSEYLTNVVPDSTMLTKEPSWADAVTTGTGAAYGVEISVSKSNGNLKGWFSYALSYSNRTLPEINEGMTFPYKYDRRHNLNFVSSYKLPRGFELSSVFTFQSRPQPPVLIIKSSDLSPRAESLRQLASSASLRAYHRLDLGISWTVNTSKRVNTLWNLSILNVYNRANGLFYFLNTSGFRYETSLLPISFSLSCSLTF